LSSKLFRVHRIRNKSLRLLFCSAPGLIPFPPASVDLITVAVTVIIVPLPGFFEVGLAVGFGVGTHPVTMPGIAGSAAALLGLINWNG
jgi:hypothetical protein